MWRTRKTASIALWIVCMTAVAAVWLLPNIKTRGAGGPLETTPLHEIIASQSGWLNTSRALTAEDLKGRIILLDFWTYCCINCIHVMPDLQYLEKKFGNKIAVIGVHSAKFKNERDNENIRQAILRHGIEHPVVNDFNFAIWQRFGVKSWPSFIILSPYGSVEKYYSGEGQRDKIERDLEIMINKYAERVETSPLPIALEKDKAPPTVLRFPGKLAYAPDLNGKPALIVADSGHNQIAVMTLSGEIIDTIGSGEAGLRDGDFDSAQFNAPQGVAYQDGRLYIADTGNHALRIAHFPTRTVSITAGTGERGNLHESINSEAQKTPLASPWDLTFWPDANYIAIAMAGTHQLWSYNIIDQSVSVIAGNGRESIDDGRAPDNSLSQPSGLAAAGDKLYFVDAETSSLRVFEGGEIKTLIGTGLFDFGYKEGKRESALMQHPLGVEADERGVYVADAYNHSIRRFDPKTGTLSNFAGYGERGKTDGPLAKASFNEPSDVIRIGDTLYVADTNNHAIRTIDSQGRVSTLKVTPPASKIAFSDTLPSLESVTPVMLAADVLTGLNLELQEGWKINNEAPSYLALFDLTAAPKPVAHFHLETIKLKSFTLPKLQQGVRYRLQGTLYYCEDKEGSQCLIKSFDVPVTASPTGLSRMSLMLN